MKKAHNLPLTLDLVPSSSWFNNVRAVLTKKQWDAVRKKVCGKAYDLCEICGGTGKEHPVECHEIWEYNDSELIQKLVGMIALCPSCHQVKHFGLAELQGKKAQALKHFMKINKLSKKDAEKYINEQFIIWAKRSKRKWELDISLLKKEYGIETKIKDKQ